MINITYKVQDEELETVKWMKDVWEDNWLVKPDNIIIQMDTLTCTERTYLDRVMRWVYKSGKGSIIINDKTYNVQDFLNA